MTIKVTCEVANYDNPIKPSIKVHSHWSLSDRVVIEIKGEEYTVIAQDLIKAIVNCTNK